MLTLTPIQEGTASFSMTRGVEKLELSFFRSYESHTLSAELKPIVLTGQNGVGKTNLLEALSFLIPGRGMRRAKLRDIRQQGCVNPWTISYYLNDGGGELRVGTGQDPENPDRRLVKINGEKAKNQAALAEWISMIWLTPQMDRLFLEGPQGRRRFLDRLVYGLDSAHAQRLVRYEKALKERNLLLSQGSYDSRWIEGVEEVLINEGVPITIARQEVVLQLQSVLKIQDPSFPQAQLSLQGELESLLQIQKSLDAEEELHRRMLDSRGKDRIARRTSLGPHQSDLITIFPEKNQQASFCSTGEQKALLLSIIMASAHLLSVRTGAIPLLLLDEVVAHLDNDRRKALFEAIMRLNMQTWLTGTDQALFEELEGKAQFVKLG